jgi:hypothetical protein
VPELSFEVTGACADKYAVAPSMELAVRVSDSGGQRIEAIALRCQIRLEPARRHYTAAEEARLHDLFGGRERWGDTMRPVQFATVPVMVPAFTGATEVSVPVPLTYDLEIGATRYFAGLEHGEVPLLVLFSGTVFGTHDGRLSVTQVPWSCEAAFRLPVSVWREAVDAHFPDSGWLRLSAATLAELLRYKTARGLPTWEATIGALLAGAAEPVTGEQR